MLQLESNLTRRGFLQNGVTLGAFMLPRMGGKAHSAETGERPARRAKSVIVLLQEGGMSHLDSWDPKPLAPAEIRGSFKTIATTNPELRVTEHLPLLAKQAHLYNVVRSAYFENKRRDHSPGLHWVLTGYDNQAAGVSLMKTNSYPSMGSVIARQLRSSVPAGIPGFVAIPSRKQLGGRVSYAESLHLGASFEALESGPIPAQASECYVLPVGLTLPRDVGVDRLVDRQRLLKAIDQAQQDRDHLEQSEGLAGYQQQAFELLLGRKGQQAFDINREPVKIRERYGNSPMGQGTLLARRLVEAGVTYVLVNYSKNNSWDTHNNNFTRLKKTLLPPMDQAASALLEDLEQRSMLDDVVVLLTGEMGRTPRVNKKSGRDHWTDVFSLMIAGGGLKRGLVLGSSSRHGEAPGTRPVAFNEIQATLYSCLGISPSLALPDRFDRPVHVLPTSESVPELFS